jgi:lipopolysaccharide export system permease protein
MKRLDVYVGRSVLAGTLLAWFVVVSLESVFVLLGELGDVGRGTYALSDAVQFVLLSLPVRAYKSFPVAALIGAVLGLGGLAAQGELNAFRLAGCSPGRLARAVVQAGALMVLAAVLVGEGWGPTSERLARQVRTSAMFANVDMRGDGFWVRDGERLIQVDHSEADGTLAALRVYQLDSTPRLVAATSAERARCRDGSWLLEQVSTTTFGSDGVKIRGAAQTLWPRLMNPHLAALLTRHPQTLSLAELIRYMTYLQQSGSAVIDYQLSFWRRLAEPLAALAMLLLAVSLVLRPLHHQSTAQRLLVAVLAGLAFKLVSEIIAQAGLVYGMPPWLAAVLPSAAVLGASLWLLSVRT